MIKTQNKSYLFWILLTLISASLILVFSRPLAFFEPDELAYYFAAQNFSKGEWTLSQEMLDSQIKSAVSLSNLYPHQLGYVPYKGRFVFVKAPGFPVLLALLSKLGLQRWGNLLLTMACIVAFILVGKKFASSDTILMALVLYLSAPITLVMIYRCYMSDFFSAGFLFLGGMGILYLALEQMSNKPMALLMSAGIGLALSLALLVRYTNAVAVAFLSSAFLYFTLRKSPLNQKGNPIIHVLLFAISGSIPLCFLCIYNFRVFGEIFATGYTLQPIKSKDTSLIILQLMRHDWKNVFFTILRNIVVLPQILLAAIPWLIVLPGALVAVKKQVPRSIYWVLSGWIFGILVVYLQYRMLMPHIFVIIARMYLPMIAPAAIICALFLKKIVSKKLLLLMGIVVLIVGMIQFTFFLSIIKVPIVGGKIVGAGLNIQEWLCLFYPQ